MADPDVANDRRRSATWNASVCGGHGAQRRESGATLHHRGAKADGARGAELRRPPAKPDMRIRNPALLVGRFGGTVEPCGYHATSARTPAAVTMPISERSCSKAPTATGPGAAAVLRRPADVRSRGALGPAQRAQTVGRPLAAGGGSRDPRVPGPGVGGIPLEFR